VDSGHTAWILVASAMVLLMTPGLAFFYSGLVRGKNVVSTIMYSFAAMAVVSIVWVLWGYSIAFGPDVGSITGNLYYLGFANVGQEDFGGIPHNVFAVFQMMFAIITAALITGAVVERFKFSTFLVFLVLWLTFVYSPVAHWVWGGGWIGDMGALDFAGGTVVHINSGVAALAAAIMVGKRKGLGQDPMQPHNIPYVVLGAGLLWFGWFGFNAGSALAADGLAGNAFLVTNTAAAAGLLTWMMLAWRVSGKPSAVAAASGAVAGLVAITPAAGFVGPLAAIAIGVGAGAFCFLGLRLRTKLRYDDALDVVAVHGIGGIWGALATGIFATVAINAGIELEGLIAGEFELFWKQIVAILATMAYSFVVTVVILKVLDLTMGLRVSEAQEAEGLDMSQHGERGYSD
jgi:Amt family ammonium transporter